MAEQAINLDSIIMTIALIGVAIIGWLIQQSISNFRESIQNLNATLKELDKTVSGQDKKIAIIETKLGINNE